MVDLAAVVKENPDAKPLPGIDGGWTWSAGRFHFAVAPAADGRHALQLNGRDAWDLDLAAAVLAFAHAHSAQVTAAAPFAVLEGFTPPAGAPFDCVAAVIPAVHRYLEFDHPEINEVTYAVFPAYRCEFSGLETEQEAAYRFDSMLDPANLRRPASPWVRLRVDNPKTGVSSIGTDLGITSADVLMQQLADLENADGAYVEVENFRTDIRRVFWSGELHLAHDDQVRTIDPAGLAQWAHRFVYEGVDSAA